MLSFRGGPPSDDKLREPPMALNPGSSTRDSSPTPQHKVAFAALRHRDYRRYLLVHLFSTMGDNIEHVISYWLL
jgi:hypothetical protein